MSPKLSDFIADCYQTLAHVHDPVASLQALAARMHALLTDAPLALAPQHLASDPTGYARNAVHVAGADEISLFSLVWLPGQWTPVHDHGTWGVVGVVQGVLEERAYLVSHDSPDPDRGFRLTAGAVNVLPAGAVCGFVEQSGHIHRVGVPEGRATCVSLHLYGRYLNRFHIYDVATGTRQRVEVTHH